MTRHLLVSAAAVLVLGLSACGAQDSEPGTAPDAESTSSAPPSEPAEPDTATASGPDLVVDDRAATGRCMVPTAEALATLPTAFEGTVTSLEDGMATLQVTRWYAGPERDEVSVAAPDRSLQSLLLAVDFQKGRSYLVSADGKRVSLCGFSGEATPDLVALYEQAFPAR